MVHILEGEHRRLVQTRFGAMHLWMQGEGDTPVILLHMSMCSGRMYRESAALLAPYYPSIASRDLDGPRLLHRPTVPRSLPDRREGLTCPLKYGDRDRAHGCEQPAYRPSTPVRTVGSGDGTAPNASLAW